MPEIIPSISVVIPTRNRLALLEDCLRSLLRQTLAPDRYEICVVDNASTDGTAAMVAALANEFPRHRLFVAAEPVIGLSHARNRGIAATSAPLIAYGDDDANMPPDWLERYLTRFADMPAGVVKIGGEIDPVWGAPRPAWLSEAMLCLLTAHSSIKSDTARLCKSGGGEVLVECNCCYRRDALTRMGGFPTMLGRKGNNLLSGDSAVDYRLMAEGAGFFYDPAILIHHRIHADRLTVDWFRRRYFWQGVTDFAVRCYLETNGVAIPDNHAVGVPMSESDWTKIAAGGTDDLDEVLRKIRGVGFFMAMIGAIEV
jgi:glycosyltransferase involved in cell wall biosynthesis